MDLQEKIKIRQFAYFLFFSCKGLEINLKQYASQVQFGVTQIHTFIRVYLKVYNFKIQKAIPRWC